MSIAIIDRSAGEEGTWKTAKTFLLGFVIGEAFLLALFSFVLLDAAVAKAKRAGFIACPFAVLRLRWK